MIATLAFPCTVTTCTPASADGAAFAELASALEGVPGIAPRLSIGNAFRPCVERSPSDGTILRADCAARRQADAERLAAIARRASGRDDDPYAVRTLAIIDLFANDERGRALDRTITHLRRLETLADQPAPVLADLAAALIVRAERAQAPRDLLEAYETAEQALRHEPRNLAALYNRALALERFGLVDETAKNWRAYLAVDSRSRWAGDARRRLDALENLPGPPTPPAADAPLSAYTAYAAADPQGARELGMDRLLGEWGEAVEAGDTARASDLLARATALGDALTRRPGGDASLADMVRAIRAAGTNASVTRELARAHREYAAGQSLYGELDYAAAHPHLVAAGAGPSPVLRQWARLSLGVSQVQLGARREGEQMLRAVATADEARYPALLGRTHWALGRTVGQNEGWERGLEYAKRSAALFTRAGERESEGAVINVAAEIRFVVGEPDSGYAALHRALQRLKPYRASIRLSNLLLSSGEFVAPDGLRASAVRLGGEAVPIATRTGNVTLAVEARVKHARHLLGIGNRSSARIALDAARALLPRIESQRARDWITADLREADALVSLQGNPREATVALDSVAAFFARIPFPFRTFPALVWSAEARLAMGDAQGALQRLESAVQLLDHRRDSLRMEPRRAAVFDAARAVVDRLVLLKLAEGRADEALRYMDHARASLAAAGESVSSTDHSRALPAGETAVEYALVADTLLIWTVTTGEVQVFRHPVDTLHLTRTLQEMGSDLQRGADEAAVRPTLSRLYDLLIRPVESRLQAGSTLVVVADGDIAAVPFAALYDSRQRRYLVEKHPLRFAISLREARRRPSREPAMGVLLISDPSLDRQEHSLLGPLQQARAEVGAIMRSYPGAAVLEGPHATSAALREGFSRSGLIHFAGHAVFDDQRPERSYLALAPERGRIGGGKITAAELAQLDLWRVRLVVLSACRTIRSGRSRAGGFTGLSGALLAAGVGGTVGSTWEVNDRSTAVLMAEFHRAYRAHADGPRALREAQLSLLRSGAKPFRMPAAWAGFRYAGR